MPSAVDLAVQARIAAARARIARQQAERATRTAARRAGVDARNRRKAAYLAAREQATRQNGSNTMTEPTPTRAQCIANLRAEATKVLARLALAEAEGRLTEKEAVVVARIRARMAADTAAQDTTPSPLETDHA